MKTLTSLAIITFTSVLFGASTGVLAEDNEAGNYDVKTKVVEFGDLNLANPSDAQVLLQRLQSAAEHTCERSDLSTDRFGSDRARCRAAGYQDAVALIDNQFDIDIEAIAGVTPQEGKVAAAR